jgi:hypothetical protein
MSSFALRCTTCRTLRELILYIDTEQAVPVGTVLADCVDALVEVLAVGGTSYLGSQMWLHAALCLDHAVCPSRCWLLVLGCVQADTGGTLSGDMSTLDAALSGRLVVEEVAVATPAVDEDDEEEVPFTVSHHAGGPFFSPLSWYLRMLTDSRLSSGVQGLGLAGGGGRAAVQLRASTVGVVLRALRRLIDMLSGKGDSVHVNLSLARKGALAYPLSF